MFEYFSVGVHNTWNNEELRSRRCRFWLLRLDPAVALS